MVMMVQTISPPPTRNEPKEIKEIKEYKAAAPKKKKQILRSLKVKPLVLTTYYLLLTTYYL